MGNVTGSSDNHTGFCMPYVDDLILRSMSDADALEHYAKIFERAAQVRMQFKPSKCTFFSTHVITPSGRIPDPKKVQAITEFPMVNSQSAVHKFQAWLVSTDTTSHSLLNGPTTCVNSFGRTKNFS